MIDKEDNYATILELNRDLKQARTESYKETTDNWLRLRTAYFMIKNVWKNCTDCFEVILE